MVVVNEPVWLKHDVDLQPYNTLKLPARARFFAEVCDLEQLQETLAWAGHRKLDVMPLGGGSNVVLAGDYPGLVLVINLTGRSVIEKSSDQEQILVRAGAGENWHEFVLWTLEQSCFGLENLSLIPGSVGAAPIQNIGAYGVEIKDVFHSLEAVNIVTGELVVFGADECRFGYRDSVFKGADRDCFVIVSVTFALSRRFTPYLGYGHLHKAVTEAAGDQVVTGRLVSDVICQVRSAKLPDPDSLGNAGSFFKNPVVADAHYRRLLLEEPELVAFPAVAGYWKLAAGWLIDRCGFKGVKRSTGAGVYQHQALVLVNHGTAQGEDILNLAKDIQAAVWSRFGVDLEIEPRVYD